MPCRPVSAGNVPLCWGTLLLAAVLGLPGGVTSLTPLTKIKPAVVELDAFAATIEGALAKLGLADASPVIHIVGASNVEDSVDWTQLCNVGAKLVLAGPTISARKAGAARPPGAEGGGDCVAAATGLYSQAMVKASRQRGLLTRAALNPDVIVLHNADLYMCQWRRTLSELLQLRKPVVLTMYCEYEGVKMERMFNWPELEFSAEALRKCDDEVRRAFGDKAKDSHVLAGIGLIPETTVLWDFEPNPHANEPPRECYSSTAHGVRNAYWMAFTGAAPKDAHEINEEL